MCRLQSPRFAKPRGSSHRHIVAWQTNPKPRLCYFVAFLTQMIKFNAFKEKKYIYIIAGKVHETNNLCMRSDNQASNTHNRQSGGANLLQVNTKLYRKATRNYKILFKALKYRLILSKVSSTTAFCCSLRCTLAACKQIYCQKVIRQLRQPSTPQLPPEIYCW